MGTNCQCNVSYNDSGFTVTSDRNYSICTRQTFATMLTRWKIKERSFSFATAIIQLTHCWWSVRISRLCALTIYLRSTDGFVPDRNDWDLIQLDPVVFSEATGIDYSCKKRLGKAGYLGYANCHPPR